MKQLTTAIAVVACFLFVLSAAPVMAQSTCLADCNGDGKVNLSDLMTMKSEFNRNNCAPKVCVESCSGMLSPFGRWCDQLNGTVKDMTTGLVWLKDAGWGGLKPWINEADWDDAHARAGLLHAGMAGAGLSDGSVEGEWRLPTKSELMGITTGTEYIRSSQMYFFTNVQPGSYWSSNTAALYPFCAWGVYMDSGNVSCGRKIYNYHVWPVRRGR